MIKAVICFALINGGALCLQQEGERYEIQCVSPRSIGVSAPRCTDTANSSTPIVSRKGDKDGR